MGKLNDSSQLDESGATTSSPVTISASINNAPECPPPQYSQIQHKYHKPAIILQQAPAQVAVPVNKDAHMVWSILNMILFFPLVFFWLPALLCSIFATKKIKAHNLSRVNRLTAVSLIFNITCTIVGPVVYLVIAIAVPLAATKQHDSSITNSLMSSYYSNYNDCFYSYSRNRYVCSYYHYGCNYSWVFSNYYCQ